MRPERATIFARLAPPRPQRAGRSRALQSKTPRGRVLGRRQSTTGRLYELRTSASRSTPAADIAKESADLILLEKSLLVLEAGLLEGRKVFANILKYVRMGASSSFGNMLSVVGASAFFTVRPDGAHTNPGQQPALRLLADSDSDGRRRPRANREAETLVHRSDHAFHPSRRTLQLHFRLHDLPHHVVRVPRERSGSRGRSFKRDGSSSRCSRRRSSST